MKNIYDIAFKVKQLTSICPLPDFDLVFCIFVTILKWKKRSKPNWPCVKKYCPPVKRWMMKWWLITFLGMQETNFTGKHAVLIIAKSDRTCLTKHDKRSQKATHQTWSKQTQSLTSMKRVIKPLELQWTTVRVIIHQLKKLGMVVNLPGISRPATPRAHWILIHEVTKEARTTPQLRSVLMIHQ